LLLAAHFHDKASKMRHTNYWYTHWFGCKQCSN